MEIYHEIFSEVFFLFSVSKNCTGGVESTVIYLVLVCLKCTGGVASTVIYRVLVCLKTVQKEWQVLQFI